MSEAAPPYIRACAAPCPKAYTWSGFIHAVGTNVIVSWRCQRFFNEPMELRVKKYLQQYSHRAKRDHNEKRDHSPAQCWIGAILINHA